MLFRSEECRVGVRAVRLGIVRIVTESRGGLEGIFGGHHTSSFKSFNLLLSRFGRLITSAFSRCSAASPVIGFAPAPGVGLSFALTQAATPRSGISRVTLPYMAATSWLCRCSVSVPGTVRNQSILAESSAWLYCPRFRVSGCLD